MSELTLRKPNIKDAGTIAEMIQYYASRGFLLQRTLGQVCESLRDFVVCEQDGVIVGCGALHLWSDLAEIRSLAVPEKMWRKGIGTAIVSACLNEARSLGVKETFVLTYQPDFFKRLGFREVSKDRFPQKIWIDCANCPHFPNCTEVALITDVEEEKSASAS